MRSQKLVLRAAGAAALFALLPVIAQVPQRSSTQAAAAQSREPQQQPPSSKSIPGVTNSRAVPAVGQADIDPAIDRFLRVNRVTIGYSKPGVGNVPVEVELQAVDRSKVVSAFVANLTVTYKGGEQRRDVIQSDFLERLIASSLPETFLPITTKAVFDEGGIYRQPGFSVDVGPDGLPPVFVTGRVTAVVFQDKTALGDRNTIDRVLQFRKHDAAYYEDLLKRVNRIREAPAIRQAFAVNAADAIPMLRKQLDEEIALALAAPKSEQRARGRAQELQHMSRLVSVNKPLFDVLMEHYAILQHALAEHSSLVQEAK